MNEALTRAYEACFKPCALAVCTTTRTTGDLTLQNSSSGMCHSKKRTVESGAQKDIEDVVGDVTSGNDAQMARMFKD